jgi:hypothetical protein
MIAAAIETGILARVIAPEKSDLPPAAARSLLKLGFPSADTKRMNQLAAKAHRGKLSAAEDRELQG